MRLSHFFLQLYFDVWPLDTKSGTNVSNEKLLNAAKCQKLIIEKVGISYSLKNIPIPSKEWYLIKLIKKIESVVKRMRWRTHFF